VQHLGVALHNLLPDPGGRRARPAQELADQSPRTADPISTHDIEDMINDSSLPEASPEDVARVSSWLAAGGWPLADPPAN
jgi:hypothetical protein